MKSLKYIALAAWALAVVSGTARTTVADGDIGFQQISDSTYGGEPRYFPFTHEYGLRGTHGGPLVGMPGYQSRPGAVWLPSIHPVQRDPVIYQRYWPNRWYGMPGGGIAHDAPRAPVVYVPTDTTQLGYYHQRVPFWTPRANAYPTAAPNPYMLHNYSKPPIGYRWYYGSYYWGQPQDIPGVESMSNGQEAAPAPAPKNDAPPPAPQPPDTSAARPLHNYSN